MSPRLLVGRKLFVVVALLFLAAWVFASSSATQSGGVPARIAPKAPEAEGDVDRKVVQVEPQREPIVIRPAAFGKIDSLKTLPAQPIKASSVLSRPEESELPRAAPSATSGPDAVVQTLPGAVDMPSPIANFDGISLADQGLSFSPPDTNGDIGYDPATGKRYYFQWINLAYKAWDVTNPAAPVVVVPLAAGNTLWQAALPGTQCAINNSGDPIALFDEQAHRWFISQFSIGGGAGNYAPFHQCVAVSQSADPAGAWYVYDYAYRDAVTYFNDYPHFGVWPDATYNAYFMTVHEFNTAGTAYLGQSAAAFDRAGLLVGNSSAPLVVFTLGTSFGGMLPADLDGRPPAGGTPGFFYMTTSAGTLQIWEFRPDWTTPANSSFGVGVAHTANYSLATASYTDACSLTTCNLVPQLSNSRLLDTLGDRLMHRVAFRVLGGITQTAVLNHTVDVDGAGVSTRTGVRWYEVQRNPGTGAWTLNQQSTYAPGTTDYRWMGSIATDQAGNIALGYSASSITINPAIRYAGRLFTDTLSTLPQAEITMTTSSGAQTGSSRWGDYSMLGVDPQDGCTFWYTQEYNGATASLPWKTRIGSFKFPSCIPVATGSLTGTVTSASTSNLISNATIVATSAISGTYATTTNVSGTYQLLGIPATTYTVTASALGFNTGTATGVSVSVGLTTTRNFTLTTAAQADLSLIKTASAAMIGANDTLTYTLSATNNGLDNITTTITLTDTLPVGFGLTSASGSGWSCSGTTTIVCTRGSLNNGQTAIVTIVGTAPASIGTFANTASVTSDVADLNLANNTATVNTTVTPQADLAITKAGPSSAAPNATLVYSLSVTNNGPQAIGQVLQTFANTGSITINDNAAATPYPVTITVPSAGPVQKATTQLLNFSHTYPGDVDVILVAPTGAKSWLMSDVIGDPNANNLNLTFDDAAAANLSCSTGQASGTYKPTNCPDSADVFPAPAPTGPYTASLAQFNSIDPTGDWRLYVRDDASADIGSISGGWNLTLLTGFTGSITVTDVLPAGTTFVGASGTGWSCSHAGGVVTCGRTALALGVAPNILITATAPAASGVITNTASVTSGLADNVPANNAAEFATMISEGPTYALSTNTVGSGTITKNPDQPAYAAGTIVMLTATPASGWSFANWSGDVNGSVNPTSITMDGHKTVTATFTLNNPVPTITSLNPVTITAGSGPFTLTVTGSNFVASSIVNWNGSNRVTTYISSTQLLAAITAADVVAQDAVNVTVSSPAPGGGTSNALLFTIAPSPEAPQYRIYLPLVARN